MNIQQQNIQSSQVKKKCTSCKNFFGSEAFAWMCSQCYKKNQKLIKSQKQQLPEVKTEVKVEKQKQTQVQIQVDKSKCFTCKRKVKLLGVECRCGMMFCNSHRLPQDHQCGFDHKKTGKDKLTKDLVKVAYEKINREF